MKKKIIYSDDNIIKTKSVVQSGHMIEIDESSIDLKKIISLIKVRISLIPQTAKEYVFLFARQMLSQIVIAKFIAESPQIER